MIGFRYLPKDSFFDRQAVQKAVDRGARKALGALGGYIRKVARNSMKEASGPHDVAAAGKPPKRHRGQLRDLLFYAYDQARRSVVIGPLLFRPRTGPPAARALEEGGEVVLAYKHRPARRIHLRPHPYMGPAHEAGIEKNDPLWRDVIA